MGKVGEGKRGGRGSERESQTELWVFETLP